MGFELVYNPVSKRFIRKGGNLHVRLVRDGIIDTDGQPIKKEEPIEINLDKPPIHQAKYKITKN